MKRVKKEKTFKFDSGVQIEVYWRPLTKGWTVLYLPATIYGHGTTLKKAFSRVREDLARYTTKKITGKGQMEKNDKI